MDHGSQVIYTTNNESITSTINYEFQAHVFPRTATTIRAWNTRTRCHFAQLSDALSVSYVVVNSACTSSLRKPDVKP